MTASPGENSIGSAIDGAPCGSFGLVSCLSFHPRKVITTGEGGMLVTSNEAWASFARVASLHGISRDAVKYHVRNAVAKLGLSGRAELQRSIAYCKNVLGLGQKT